MTALPYGYVDALPPARDVAQRVAARPVERELADRARLGDDVAFTALHDRYRPAVRNYLYRLTSDWHRAEDLTQDAFAKAWLKIGDTAPGLAFHSWIYKIATNKFLDHVRHERLVQWQPWEHYLASNHPTQATGDTTEGGAVGAEEAAAIRAVIEALGAEPSAAHNPEFAGAPARWREVLILREYHDLTYQEIGDRLGLSRPCVKTLLFRARRRFRQLWRERAEAEAAAEASP